MLTLLGDIFCYSTSDDFFCYSKCSYCWFVRHPLYERCVARSSAVVYVARIKCFLFHPHTFTVLSSLPVARRPSARTATQRTQSLCPVRVASTLHTPDPGELSFHTFTVLSSLPVAKRPSARTATQTRNRCAP